MSRKKDPIVAVLNYFESAPLEAVEIAFALIKEKLQQRRPKVVKRSHRKPPPASGTGGAPKAASTKAASAKPVPPKNTAAQAAIAREADRPLPLSGAAPDLGLPRK